MKRASFVISEVVAFIIHDEIDDRTFPQSRGLVEYDASVRDSRSQWAHAPTIRSSAMPRNLSTGHFGRRVSQSKRGGWRAVAHLGERGLT